MLGAIKPKNKRPSTLSVLKNMKTASTLSDRLKLAGIKEIKAQPGRKPINNLNKNSKQGKGSFRNTQPKNPQNQQKELFLKDPNKNQDPQGEIISKKSAASSTNLKKNFKNGAEETLSASLNFIKDFQKYKNKFKNPKEDSQSDLKSPMKKTKLFSTDCHQYLDKTKESQQLKNENPATEVPNEKNSENSWMNEEFSFHTNKYEKLETEISIEDELRSFIQENVKKIQNVEPSFNKLSLENIARIDKKYFESILSLATNTEENKRKSLKENKTGKEGMRKSSGVSSYSETKQKELEVNCLKNADKTGVTKKVANTSEKDQTSARILRDLTKSEMQIQRQDIRYMCSQRNSEIKVEKDLIHSKPKLNEGRKKRKPRKRNLKNNNEDVIEIPFSNEVSKAKDVRELWRREIKKKSENSLTSHSSSCTIPESDETPNWKNLGLQSYRILQKLVEEEINKISKKSENKNDTEEVKTRKNNIEKVHENKAEVQNEAVKTNDFCITLNLPTVENTTESSNLHEKEPRFNKKKLISSENSRNYATYEGEKNKSELLSRFVQDRVKTPELKLLEETEKKCCKISNPAIQNRSILNRLEQAFLALGSPKFQNESMLKVKQGCKNDFSQNGEFLEKVSEENEKQRKIKLQNQSNQGTLPSRKNLKPLVRPKLTDNESMSSAKRKTNDVKPSPPSSIPFPVQSKKKNKSCSRRSSNVIVQNDSAEDNLERKGTFDIISFKDNGPLLQSQKSKSCHKINDIKLKDNVKKRFIQTKNQEPENSKKEIVKNNTESRSKSIEKEEGKTKLQAHKNTVKPLTEDKIPQSHECSKTGTPRLPITNKERCKRTLPVEEPSKQQITKKKRVNLKNSNERPVKGRSILSMRGNQPGTINYQAPNEKLQHFQEDKVANITTALKSGTGELLMKNVQKNYEELVQKPSPIVQNNVTNISCTRTNTKERLRSNLENFDDNSKLDVNYFPKKNQLENRHKFSLASSLSQNICQQSQLIEKDNAEFPKPRNKKNLSLWERDIHCYREIVKDIMGQYKRIDGFLKQSEYLGSLSNKFVCSTLSKKHCCDDESTKFSDDSLGISLKEYRKKIITEYQALPFFEYKQQKREESAKLEEAKKRNLSVVTDIKKEMDFDVKDYQPNVKKVLDSQLYVDTDNLFQRNGPEGKLKDKKSSLQEMMLGENSGLFKKNCLKSLSMPKTFLLPGSEVYSIQSVNRRQQC